MMASTTWTACGRVGLTALLLAFVSDLSRGATDAEPAAARTEIHFAFSKSMFTDVNENDARAAMKVYTQIIGDQNGIYVSREPILLDGTNAIAQALGLKRTQMFALTAQEFLAMEELGLEGPFLCSSIRGTFTEEYLLLSREDSPLRQVADLKGRSLIVPSEVRSCLATCWLEVLCREQGLGPATRLLGKITSSPKPSQVVLPVFFGKADACLITRNGYEVMCELNPQLKKQLRVVAVSPPVVPALSCFGRGLSEEFKQRTIKAVELSSAKPIYRQLMTLFKADSVEYQPLAMLEETRKLVAKYQKLCGAANAATGQQASVTPVKEAMLK